MIRLVILGSLLISGCSGQVTDPLLSRLASFAVNDSGSVSVVSNSTSSQARCVSANQVVVQVSAAPNARLFCRDSSTLMAGVNRGQVCPGGVSVLDFPVDSGVVDCRSLTLCGVAPSGRRTVAARFDGAPVEELTFTNLPWGCRGRIEFSSDPSLGERPQETMVQIVAPECPFCISQNRTTCEPCADLGDATVIGGAVIPRSCTGGVCASCSVGSKTVPHGGAHTFFERTTSACGGKKCVEISLVRVCNNGLFEGAAKYSHPQCLDVKCGCSLPGSTIVFDSGTVKDIFKTASPACGRACESIRARCDDGVWYQSDQSAISPAMLAQFPAAGCSVPECNCVRPNRATVAQGASATVFSKGTVACGELCASFAGTVTCTSGVLTSAVPNHLTFAFDQCTTTSCGCSLQLDGGTRIIPDQRTQKIHKFDTNSAINPTACTDPANSVSVTCANGTLSPAFDQAVYKFSACNPQNLDCDYKINGVSLAKVSHNGILKVHKTAVPACGQECEAATLTCRSGTFYKSDNTAVDSSFLAVYQAVNCALKQCDCFVGNAVLRHGAPPVTLYSKGTVECEMSGCDAYSRQLSCNEGQLVGGDAAVFSFSACQERPCRCRLPSGATLGNGSSANLYSVAAATCAAPTACSDAANSTTVTCNQGVLSAFDSAKFRFDSCLPASCGCTHAGVTVPVGQSGFFYKIDNVPSGLSCADVAGNFTCQTGGSFTAAGLNVADYPKSSCISDRDQGSFGGTGGGSGNDEGPGSGFRRRRGSGDGSGGSAPCYDGPNCSTFGLISDFGGLKRPGCKIPWTNGEIEHYASVVAFKRTCVVRPAKCSSFRQLRTCQTRGLTGSNDYVFSSCVERDVCP